MTASTTLEAFLRTETGSDPIRAAVAQTVLALASAGCDVWRLAQGGGKRDDDAPVVTGTNFDGDQQTQLDVLADGIFLAAATRSPVAAYASEEQEEPLRLNEGAVLALAIDPLDGSSNVDLNLSFGTIFAILPIPADAGAPLAAFLQAGSSQLAAGFIVYGPQLTFVLTLGEGTHLFAYRRPEDDFVLVERGMRVSAQASEFAINASNYRHWDESVRFYFDDCVKGVHGPRERNYNMRWLASLVVEAYRILRRGGVFLYPADKRPGYGQGRLRLVYEANPVAFVIEQAGGAATNGVENILSLVPQSLHQRTPLVFGSGREVAKLTRYHTEPSALEERAPLFGNRGLFRT